MKVPVTAMLFLSLAFKTAFTQYRSDKAIGRSLDSILQTQFKPGEPGMVVLAARKGRIIYQKAYGSANVELNVPLQPDMVFRIASISKQFTAIGVLRLMEQGRLRLTDSLQQYLPDFPSKGATITIEHLLTHTSGIPDFMGIDHPDPYIERHDLKPQMIIDHFKNRPLQFRPGTRYAYSNSGYTLLAAIIEKVSGRPFYQYMREEVLQRAGLQHTQYADELTIIPGRVSGYTRDKGFYQNTYYQSISLGYGCGDLLSTAGDLFAWHQALHTYKLVSKATLEKAMSPYILTNGTFTGYGYGWMISSKFGKPFIKHEGQASGFISLEGYFPEQDVFVVVLTNVKSGEDRSNFSQERFLLFSRIPELVIGNLLPPEAAVPAEQLKAYTGKYRFDKGNKVIQVRLRDGRLYLEDGMEFKMYALTNWKFYVFDLPTEASVVFKAEAAGKITGLEVQQAGDVFQWVKTD